LCLHYGPLIDEIDDIPFHDFPDPDALAVPGVESHLRELGFGYRAKYLARTAIMVAKEKPTNWLQSLSQNSDLKLEDDSKDELMSGSRKGYRDAHDELLGLQGVGPKVADCVCLMGLGWGEAVPVDTHVWQIAQRDYRFGKGKHKSLTKATYDAVGDYFRNLWGMEAGWAHSVLFAADLRTFSIRATSKTEVDVEEAITKQVNSVLQDRTVLVKRAIEDEMVKEEPLDDTASAVTGKPRRKTRRV
jgi:N-glycosylase/DNA lyase